MKKDIILIGAMLFLILVISQVKGQDCLPRLIKASKDTTFIVDDSNLLLVERPTSDAYVVTMTFVKKEPVIVNNTELIYTGIWEHPSGAWGTISHSGSPGSTAKYSFTGKYIEVYGTLASHHGTLEYQINLGTPKSVNLASAVRQDGVLIINEPVPSGFNTITFRVVDKTVLIDYLVIR